MTVRVSPREREVAALVADGLSYAQVAARIGWKERSVRVLAHRLAQRLPGIGEPKVKLTRYTLEAASMPPNVR